MKTNDFYVFPAVLTFEEGYEIAVTFPDLFGMEKDEDEIPSPSSFKDVKKNLEPNECVVLVEVFMPAIRMTQENKSVNRSVTLPAWLNARALECGVNFSAVLQDALKNQLNINR